jgi:hypothetical protein
MELSNVQAVVEGVLERVALKSQTRAPRSGQGFRSRSLHDYLDLNSFQQGQRTVMCAPHPQDRTRLKRLPGRKHFP